MVLLRDLASLLERMSVFEYQQAGVRSASPLNSLTPVYYVHFLTKPSVLQRMDELQILEKEDFRNHWSTLLNVVRHLKTPSFRETVYEECLNALFAGGKPCEVEVEMDREVDDDLDLYLF